MRADLKVSGRVIDVRGVDDPYLGRDRLDAVRGKADPKADLRLGIAHAPQPRVIDAYTADGVELLLAGHTHGGQVCLPGFGPLVTNCGIDRARARGLSATAPAATRPGCTSPPASALRPTRRSASPAARKRPADLDRRSVRADGDSAERSEVERGLRPARLPRPRGVAQLGSALRSGRRGRRFKSCHPDQGGLQPHPRALPGV